MKRLFTLWLACVAILSISANPVSKENARKLAERFLQEKGLQVGSEAARARGGKTTSGVQPLYVFNTVGDRGFVLVAGDDRAEGIMGYTTQGHFDENDLPENFRAWLEQTSAEIEALTKQPQQSVTSDAKAVYAPQQVPFHGRIDPLIITEWNQGNTDNVYNAHLPLVGGQRPCTGCVATAGAQVMYYYKWPQALTQVVPGYTLEKSHGANTEEDLPAITFQWSKMKTIYNVDDDNTDAVNAVADLMLYCGYAAHMNYGLSDAHGGSSASEYTLAEGMSLYFDYNPKSWKYVSRSNYSIAEWDALIYNELANMRPVIYSGSFNGGHAFICDGYDGEGLFHFNWGWGGSYNGFFKLQATNPKGIANISDMGYISGNTAIIGLQPNSWPDFEDPSSDDEWNVIEVEGVTTRIYDYSVENSQITVGLWNASDNTYSFGFALGELKSDGKITLLDTKYESQENYPLDPWYLRYLSFDVSSYGLSSGPHKLVPLCKLKGESTWKMCIPTDLYFEANVLSGSIIITPHPIENLKINEFEMASGGTPYVSQGVRINVTNNGDNLEKALYIFAGSADDKGVMKGSFNFKIAHGSTKEFRTTIGKMDKGTYTLRLTSDSNGEEVLATTQITIAQDLRANDFSLTGKKIVNQTIKVDVTVENHAGDYTQPLYLFASTTNDKKRVYAAGSAIEQGGSEVITFYFKPDHAGTWNLWIGTDSSGNDVIGQSSVQISEALPAKLNITSKVLNLIGNVVKAEDYVVKVNVTNIGEYAYDDVIEARLFKQTPGTNSGSQVDIKTYDLQLEPNAKTSFNFAFDDLEDGSNYFCWIYYYSRENSTTTRYQASGGYSYTFEYTPGIREKKPGDANGDEKVDANDVKALIDYMNGSGTINMDAADLDGDNKITIADIIKSVNLILSK